MQINRILNEIGIDILIEGKKHPNFHTTVVLIKKNDNGKYILFDTGFPYDKDLLSRILKEKEIDTDDIDDIVLSHWHLDHCGSIELFEKAKIYISCESLYNIYSALNCLHKAEISNNINIDILTEIIAKELGNELGNEIVNNKPRLRAMANLELRNRHVWEIIFEKIKEGKIKILNEDQLNISERINIYKVSAHTKGDLIMKIEEEQRTCYLVGDSIPYKEIKEIPMLTESKDAFKDFWNLICKDESIIVPGHGEPFLIDSSFQKNLMCR